MGRPKDKRYWNQVTKEEDGLLKCKRCGHKFKGGVSRIKAHVDRIERQGIAVCSADDRNDGVHNGIASCSSDAQEAVNAINPVGVGGSAPVVHTVAQSNNSCFGSDLINSLNESVRDLTREEGDIKGQLEWLESRGKKRKRQVDDWLNNVQDLKHRAGSINNSIACEHEHELIANGVIFEIPGLINEVRRHKLLKPLVLSNELVGRSFEGNVKKMWELLGNDQVFIIGVYGMGGVGKTCLVTHVADEIKRRGTFKHVFWVSVSRNFSISKLQQDIAKTIGFKLHGDDERTEAENLSSALETKENSVLILDDVWQDIDLQKVGIPLKANGIKLVLTTRLEHVYQLMEIPPNNMIRMRPLSYAEGLELFSVKIGQNITSKLSRIVDSIVKECDGLPLGIISMARTVKKVNSIHCWRHASKMEQMEKEVLKKLKLSYDNLMEDEMQNEMQDCFLYCALYHRISRSDLIMTLVEGGMINGNRSIEDIFDEGCAILDKLKGQSLLLEGNMVHGLLRKMACHILKETHRCMIKCDRGLSKIPHMLEWTADLEVFSLDSNTIEEIPAGTSPSCPRLSTLILSNNPICSIPDYFFIHMKTLTILDLSCNDRLTALPDSLSDLSSLISLVLKGCLKLEYVPPLGALQALSRLDISETSVKEVRGLEMLTNLRWLDLSNNPDLRSEPEIVLRGLINLQYLDLYLAGSLYVKSEDVQGMTMLECFGGSFHDRENYNNYVKNIENRHYGPKYYRLHLGTKSEIFEEEVGLVRIAPEVDHECRILVFGDREESPHWLPRDLAKLYIYENTHWTSLCGALSSNGPSSLRTIEIQECTELESLFCLFGNCPLCTNLKNLEELNLEYLESLTIICKEDVADRTQALSPNGLFSHLKHFKISFCSEIETLVTPRLLSQLQNLETIIVEDCASVREIFAVSSSDGDVEGASAIAVPKLTKLELIDLPLLETVSKGVIICGSMPELKIAGCPNLESHPTIQVSS